MRNIFLRMKVLSCSMLITVIAFFGLFSGSVQADVVFWTSQGEELASHVGARTGGLIDQGRGIVRSAIVPALINGNPYVQLDVLVTNARNTTLTFDPSRSAGYYPGQNRLIWGQTIGAYDEADVLLHEMRHGTQEFFRHPSSLLHNLDDPIHTAFAEIDGCLAKYGGDVSSAMTCAIDRYQGIGFLQIQGLHPDFNDMQTFGMIRHLSNACAGPIMDSAGNLTACGAGKYEDALRMVSDPSFSLSQADLIVPGGASHGATKKMLSAISAISHCPGAKYIPFVGIGASLVSVQESWAMGDYEAAIVEGCTNIPVVGDFVITPAQIVGDYTVAPLCEWLGTTNWLANQLVDLYDTGNSGENCTVIYLRKGQESVSTPANSRQTVEH
jgi:hypothetical protein